MASAIISGNGLVRQSPRVAPEGSKDQPEKSHDQLAGEARRILAEECKGFSLTKAKEYLAYGHGIVLGRRTLRQLMVATGSWRPPGEREPRSEGLPRRSCRGELVKWSAGKCDWLERRGDRLCLIAMIDDATAELTARFVEHDSTEENFRLLETYVLRHGRPIAVCTDRASMFQTAPKIGRDGAGRLGTKGEISQPTQIGRALGELGIGWIPLPSGKLGDDLRGDLALAESHLLESLRTAGVKRLADANRYLEDQFLPWWKQNMTVQPESAMDAHRPLGDRQNLAGILGVVSLRQVGRDGSIRFNGKRYQVTQEARARIRSGNTVRIEVRLDGSIWARSRGLSFMIHECPPRANTAGAQSLQTTALRRGGHRPSWRPTLGRIADGGLPVWKAAQINRVRVVDRLD